MIMNEHTHAFYEMHKVSGVGRPGSKHKQSKQSKQPKHTSSALASKQSKPKPTPSSVQKQPPQ